MAQELTIQWRQESATIYAAYLTGRRDRDIYVGYVAINLDQETWWRGYMGANFTPVGRGPLLVMQAAIEQMVREELERAASETAANKP